VVRSLGTLVVEKSTVAPKKKPMTASDRVNALIKEVEALAKRLQTDIRKRVQAAGLLKNLQSAANRLRTQAAKAAAQVEKYVHELRKDLERSAKPAPRAKARKKPKKRPASPAAVGAGD
jgi:glutamate-1-semialdehyde aminotransferase